MADYGIQFNNSGYVTIPAWASGSGDFTLTVDFTTPSTLETDGLIGTDSPSTASDFLAVYSDGKMVFRLAGTSLIVTTTGIISTSTRYTAEVIRSGTSITLNIYNSGGLIHTQGGTSSSSFGAVRVGSVGSSPLPFSGIVWSIQLTGGTNDRDYQNTTGTGTTWSDTISSQDGTLTSLAVDPWVLDSSISPSITTIGTTDQWVNLSGTLLTSGTYDVLVIDTDLNVVLTTTLTPDSNGDITIQNAALTTSDQYGVIPAKLGATLLKSSLNWLTAS